MTDDQLDEQDDSRPDPGHINGRHALAPADLAGLVDFVDAFEQVSALNVYEHHYVDDQRRDRFTIVRAVLRAERDAVDSCVIAHRAENGDRLPEIIPAGACHVQVDAQPEHGWLIARVAFDRQLAAGETAILGYQVRWHSAAPTVRHARYLPRSLREYLLRVTFDDGVPTRCWSFHEPATTLTYATKRPLRVGATGSVHAHLTDISPGLAGIRWSWDRPRS